MLADGPVYRLVDLGEPSWLGGTRDTFSSSKALGINDVGAIVGEYTVHIDQQGDETRAFLWIPKPMYHSGFTSKGIYDLKHVFSTLESSSTARDLTDDGFVVGWTLGTGGFSAFLWDVFTLQGSVMVPSAQAYAIKRDDSVSPPRYWVVGDLGTFNPAFRLELFNPPEVELHAFGSAVFCGGQFVAAIAYDVHWSNAAVGSMASGPLSQCDDALHANAQAVQWPANDTLPVPYSGLPGTIFDSLPKTEALGMNIDLHAVGYSVNPDDPGFRERAVFWASTLHPAMPLPHLAEILDGDGIDETRANAVRDPMADGEIQIVGMSEGTDSAVLWRRIPVGNGVYENHAYNLNDESMVCMPEAWDGLFEATDINNEGWIVGWGRVNGDQRAFLLVPEDGPDACIGDVNLDCLVGVGDILAIILSWGDCEDCCDCPADLNGDCTVGVGDLLIVILNWGACDRCPGASGPTLSQVLADAGLTQEQWDAYIAVLEGEDESAKRNWNCWMSNYLSGCTTCPPCPGPDPFGDVSGEN